jgi:hypothetical protein
LIQREKFPRDDHEVAASREDPGHADAVAEAPAVRTFAETFEFEMKRRRVLAKGFADEPDPSDQPSE